MSAWIGPLGGLVEILHYKGRLSVSQERAQSTRITLGGRIKVQRGPRARREWRASTPYTSGGDAAGLMALELAGSPPWVWVDPDAQVTNLFTPEQSTLAPGTWSGAGFTQGGALAVDGATVPHSVAHPSGGSLAFGLRDGSADGPAVIPGSPVSASVYVRGDGVLAISWRDWDGAELESVTQTYNHPAMDRVALLGQLPPAGAVSAQISLTGARQAAMPCLTWTQDAPRWSSGQGCTRAVVEDLTKSVEQAHPHDPARRYSSLSFTIREVG